MHTSEKEPKESFVERNSRRLRNVGIVGAVAVVGAAVLFPPSVLAPAVAGTAAGLAGAGAFASELIRERAARHRQEKSKEDKK